MLDKIINLIKRPPDFVVQRTVGVDYLKRWWIIPRNNFFNIYLHNFHDDDDSSALHDHRYVNMSILLSGSYIEHLVNKTIFRKKGSFIFRLPSTPHRIELMRDENQKPIPMWTLFITGFAVRDWGFYPNGKFVNWRDYTTTQNGVSKVKEEFTKK